MQNYWFLYKSDTGDAHGAAYFGYADEWTNIPEGCGVLGPFPEDNAPQEVKDAFNTGCWKINLETKSIILLPVPAPWPQPPAMEERLSAVEGAILALMG